ncbi:hypothetical protein N7453_003836 [Penicillium expansum]|nr:hypothetical protein N7453_003836 [Penicillium expansum]
MGAESVGVEDGYVAAIVALVELEDGPPACIALRGAAGHPGFGLEPAPHVAGADRTAGGGWAAGVDVRVGWVEFGKAGADEGVGEEVGAVSSLIRVAASAASVPVGGDGGHRWGGEGAPGFGLQGGSAWSDDGCGGHAGDFDRGRGGHNLHTYVKRHGWTIAQNRPGAGGGAGDAEAAGAGTDPDPDSVAAEVFVIDNIGLVE